MPQSDPIAYFLTWPTYGTWLSGDERGWVEYHHGWQEPDPIRKLEAEARMTEDACILTAEQRQIVEAQVSETCAHRGWMLHAVNCRSNHIHVVVTANQTEPKRVRNDIKAWCTRRLKERTDADRENWWAERGSQRQIYDEDRLARVIEYVLEAQDRKARDHM
jgi:REP element-mobilizing transposase RayT